MADVMRSTDAIFIFITTAAMLFWLMHSCDGFDIPSSSSLNEPSDFDLNEIIQNHNRTDGKPFTDKLDIGNQDKIGDKSYSNAGESSSAPNAGFQSHSTKQGRYLNHDAPIDPDDEASGSDLAQIPKKKDPDPADLRVREDNGSDNVRFNDAIPGGLDDCWESSQLKQYGEKVDNRILTDNVKDVSFIESEVCCALDEYTPHCFFDECDSHPKRCDSYGTCCSYFSRKKSCEGKQIPKRSDNVVMENGNVCKSNDKRGYLTIRKCPPDFSDSVTRKLCQEDVPLSEITLHVVTTVTDDLTGVSYYNKYCAECNNAPKISSWNTSLECLTYLYVLDALDDADLFKRSTAKHSTCQVKQTPSGKDKHVPVKCDPKLYKKNSDVISSCNVTGLEKSYAPGIEGACLSGQKDLFQRVAYGNSTFKNAYCLMCNRMYSAGLICEDSMHRSVAEGSFLPPPAFSFVFGIRRLNHHNRVTFRYHTKCANDEWEDPEANCHRIHCARGKILQHNNCVTALKTIKGLPYYIRLWLFPKVDEGHRNPFHGTDLNFQSGIIYNKLNSMLANLSNVIEFSVGVGVHHGWNVSERINRTHQHDVDGWHVLSWMEAYVEATRSITRDEFEETVLDMFVYNDIRNINDAFNDTTLFKVQIMDGDESPRDIIEGCKNATTFSLCNVTHFELSPYTKPYPKSDYLKWQPVLTCPHVRIPKDQFNITSNFSFRISIKIRYGNSTTELTDPFELNQVFQTEDDNLSFSICRQLLEEKFKVFANPQDNRIILYWLTIVCLSASMICLSMTAMTYLLFPSLRGISGWNTLGLSLSLLVAQIVTLVVSSLTLTNIPAPLCVTMGVCLHYAWLVFLTWSYLCCHHMMRVFTANIRLTHIGAEAERRKILKNVAQSFMIPLSVLVTYMVACHFGLEGTTLGYSSQPSVGCIFMTPLGIYIPLTVVVIINTIFFIIVVWKIVGVRRLQSTTSFRKDDKRSFFVYIKLSTFTGMFWLLTLLAEILHSDILRYPSIVINGFQGVFIFASFVLNQRVMNMYAERFYCMAWLGKSKNSMARFSHSQEPPKEKTVEVKSSTELTQGTANELCHETVIETIH